MTGRTEQEIRAEHRPHEVQIGSDARTGEPQLATACIKCGYWSDGPWPCTTIYLLDRLAAAGRALAMGQLIEAERDEARAVVAAVEGIIRDYAQDNSQIKLVTLLSRIDAALGAAVTPTPQSTEKPMTCTAAANMKGEHITCDLDAEHGGWAHSNRKHELIWDGQVTPTPEATTDEADAMNHCCFAGCTNVICGRCGKTYCANFPMHDCRPAAVTGHPTDEPPTWLADIAAERKRAHEKHGDTSMESMPPHDPTGRRFRILVEEVGEIGQEFNDAEHQQRPVDLAHLREELIQVAAMAGAWADACSPGPAGRLVPQRDPFEKGDHGVPVADPPKED